MTIVIGLISKDFSSTLNNLFNVMGHDEQLTLRYENYQRLSSPLRDCVVIGLGVEGGTARQISKVLGCGSLDVWGIIYVARNEVFSMYWVLGRLNPLAKRFRAKTSLSARLFRGLP